MKLMEKIEKLAREIAGYDFCCIGGSEHPATLQSMRRKKGIERQGFVSTRPVRGSPQVKST